MYQKVRKLFIYYIRDDDDDGDDEPTIVIIQDNRYIDDENFTVSLFALDNMPSWD